jgi:hypothetical protein
MRFRTKDPFYVLLAVVERQSHQHIRFFRHLFRSPSSLSAPVGRKTEVSFQLHSFAIGVESSCDVRRDSVPDLFMSQTRTTVLYKVVPLTSLYSMQY